MRKAGCQPSSTALIRSSPRFTFDFKTAWLARLLGNVIALAQSA
jgi:hypothetical protein